MGLGLADPILHDHHASPDPILLPKSTIYNRSCTRFSKPFLTTDDTEDFPATRNERIKVALQRINKCQRYCQSTIPSHRYIIYKPLYIYIYMLIICASITISAGCNLHNAIAWWDTHFQTGAETVLLHPFSPILIASDDAGGGGCISLILLE
ncbi:putative regulatory associated protein of TOR [Helianthus annuus]|nr:putative regulatory associated protein of TOR [Helianthus annuus]